jgi:hypothetical protein
VTYTVRRQISYVLAVLIAGVAGLTAGAGKPSTLTPVTATFRCPVGLECVGTDGISADLGGAYTGAVTGSEQGPYFDSGSNLYFPLQPGLGRFVSIDFSTALGTPACAAKATCRKNFTIVFTDDSRPASITNPLDAMGTALPNGFLSIAVGQSARARYKLNFADPSGRSLLWTVRFNSSMYPGSTELTVTRTATNTWVVEASASDVAELVSTTTSGRSVTVNEGYYAMPFKITVVH